MYTIVHNRAQRQSDFTRPGKFDQRVNNYTQPYTIIYKSIRLYTTVRSAKTILPVRANSTNVCTIIPNCIQLYIFIYNRTRLYTTIVYNRRQLYTTLVYNGIERILVYSCLSNYIRLYTTFVFTCIPFYPIVHTCIQLFLYTIVYNYSKSCLYTLVYDCVERSVLRSSLGGPNVEQSVLRSSLGAPDVEQSVLRSVLAATNVERSVLRSNVYTIIHNCIQPYTILYDCIQPCAAPKRFYPAG